ncbi:hypothetical protein Tco_0469974, partial [Tanacetum coccineum]
ARLVCHDDQIDEIYDHLNEIPLESLKSMEQEIETLCERVKAYVLETKVLRDSLGIAQDRIKESQIHMEDAEVRLQQSKFRDIMLRACLRRLKDRLACRSLDLYHL